MPIDARIPLMLNPPAAPQIGAGREQVLRLRDMARLGDARQLQIDQARRDAEAAARDQAKQEALRRSFVVSDDGTVDRKSTLDNMLHVDRLAAADQVSDWATADQAAAAAETKRKTDDLNLKKLEYDKHAQALANAAALGQTVKDQTSWTAFLDTAVKQGLMSQDDADERPVYDTNAALWLRQQTAQAQGLADTIAQKQKEIEDEYKQLTQSLDIAGRLAPLLSGEEGATTLHEITQGRLRPFVGDAITEDVAARLQQAGMTPSQRGTAEQQAVPNTVLDFALATGDPNRPPEERARYEDALKRANAYQQGGRAPAVDRSAETKQQQFQKWQAEHDQLFDEENTLHAQNEAAGIELNTIHTQIDAQNSRDAEEQDKTALRNLDDRRRTLEAKIAENEARIETLQTRRAVIQRRKDAVYRAAGNATPQASADTVMIKRPDGQVGTIPRANLAQAKAAGAQEVQ